MSESKCYLCTKPGNFEKLFRNCKHETACYDCLRDRYVIQAQVPIRNLDGSWRLNSLYPLTCFHPECNLVLRDTQIKRLIVSQQEMQNYRRWAKANPKNRAKLENAEAKMRREILTARFGPRCTPDLAEALQGEEDVCRCPKCNIMIIKNGGCYHMTCFCGAEFDMYTLQKQIDQSCRDIETKYNRLTKFYEGLLEPDLQAKKKTTKPNRAPLLQMDNEPEDYDCEDYSVADEGSDDSTEAEITAEGCDLSVNPMASDLDSVPSDYGSDSPSISFLGDTSAVDGSQGEWGHDDFEVLELASNRSDDSWTRFESDGDFQASISSQVTAWEEVSQVSSVISFHSKTGMSFLEAARKKASIDVASWKVVSKLPKPTKCPPLYTIDEDRKPISIDQNNAVLGEMFDADFMLEGAKYSRGGKQKFKTKVVP